MSEAIEITTPPAFTAPAIGELYVMSVPDNPAGEILIEVVAFNNGEIGCDYHGNRARPDRYALGIPKESFEFLFKEGNLKKLDPADGRWAANYKCQCVVRQREVEEPDKAWCGEPATGWVVSLMRGLIPACKAHSFPNSPQRALSRDEIAKEIVG
jgi:hypothetical protein